MTNEDEEYFGDLKLMFGTPGWAKFKQDLLEQSLTIGDLQLTTDQRDLDYRKGQLATIGYILNYEDIILRAEKEALEGDSE